jgi:hypothetical protein
MIRLTRSVDVSTFDTEATVAVGRDRPEFLAVARLAADLARPIGARDVLRELLGARPEVLGLRVIERCVGLGLLERLSKDSDATLSEAGRLALEHGEVLVPEEGIWRFFVIDDPLVPSALVHAQRLEAESVRQERAAAKDARTRGERRLQSERPPEILHRCSGASPRESVQNGHLFQLGEIAESGAAGPSGELRLVFTWSAEPSIRLSGRLPLDGDGVNAKPIDAGVPLPEIVARLSRERLWRSLVTQATQVPGFELERWQAIAGKPVVPADFPSLPAAARHSFRQGLEVPAMNLVELGHFEPTTLNDVELVPASDSDAQAWLGWLQWEAVNDYVTRALLEKQGNEQRARFLHHRPRALSASELLAKARADRDERSWFLLGPSDLGLWS